MTLFSLALTLFLIMDPIGSIRPFIDHTEGLKPSRQKRVIIREMFFALGFMILFDFLGEHLFQLFDISDTTVYLASGVILFLIALKIIFPKKEAENGVEKGKEPFLVPLAIPIIAGPALLATIMLFSSLESNPWQTLGALSIAWLCSCVILIFSRTILRYLGTSGLTAGERLMGIVLILIAIQRILHGISIFASHTTA